MQVNIMRLSKRVSWLGMQPQMLQLLFVSDLPRILIKKHDKILCHGRDFTSRINDFVSESFSNLCTFPLTIVDEKGQIISSLKCKTISYSYDIPEKFLKMSVNN